MKNYNTEEAKDLARNNKNMKCITDGLNKGYIMYYDDELKFRNIGVYAIDMRATWIICE